jgi:hypothetical protein
LELEKPLNIRMLLYLGPQFEACGERQIQSAEDLQAGWRYREQP